MSDDITATFTIEEFRLLKDALERLHFFGGEEVRARAWGLILKVNTLLPSLGFSSHSPELISLP